MMDSQQTFIPTWQPGDRFVSSRYRGTWVMIGTCAAADVIRARRLIILRDENDAIQGEVLSGSVRIHPIKTMFPVDSRKPTQRLVSKDAQDARHN